ncbi:EAL domain-containing protein [Sneathiella sp.]|uniref:EAL domain-containing protein n=1 Tax=Sneathiella sp. TaxID=1964365 RepID=UPI00260E4EBB|nr:EAL domain-containing protein [Sneathiella sp.]MDF2366233.1 EAL domain-containing protein [Sneathiella sp.]
MNEFLSELKNFKEDSSNSTLVCGTRNAQYYTSFLETINNAVVHYQPIIGIRGNACVGVEALIRPNLHHKSMSFQQFIQYAEDMAIVPRITEVVLKDILVRVRALSSITAHASQALLNTSADPFFYSVNVSPFCLRDQACIDLVNQFLHVANDDFKLVLELSERDVFPDSLLEEFYDRVGCDDRIGFALDDFGVGEARFENLSLSKLDYIKIDKSFVPHEKQVNMMKTLSAIIGFSSIFAKNIIVEGIETEDQLDMVSSIDGVGFVQGFLFARPTAWDNFLACMASTQAVLSH